MTTAARALALILPLLASCASIERDADWSKRMLAEEPTSRGFQIPKSLELGFDDIDADAVWHVGDRVLYGVRLVTEDTEKTWFIRFTLAELPPDRATPDPEHKVTNATLSIGGWMGHGVDATYHAYSERAVHRVEVFDGDGSPRASRDYSETSYAHVEETRIASMFTQTIKSVIEMTQNVPELDRILMQAIDPPSLWSVIRHGGVVLKATVDPMNGKTGHVSLSRGRHIETLRLPVPLDANGTPCLDAIVELTWKQSPLLLCHGVVGVDAVHPNNPGRRVTIRLLGARRGRGHETDETHAIGHTADTLAR